MGSGKRVALCAFVANGSLMWLCASMCRVKKLWLCAVFLSCVKCGSVRFMWWYGVLCTVCVLFCH